MELESGIFCFFSPTRTLDSNLPQVRAQETGVTCPSEVVAWGKGEEAWRRERRRLRFGQAAPRRVAMRGAERSGEQPRSDATKQSGADWRWIGRELSQARPGPSDEPAPPTRHRQNGQRGMFRRRQRGLSHATTGEQRCGETYRTLTQQATSTADKRKTGALAAMRARGACPRP